MFDIGFAELIIIGVVALLVIGPERLPEAIRTGSAWLNRLRRGFNDIKQEVQQELHNDAVLRDLRESGEKLQEETRRLKQSFDAELGEDAFDAVPRKNPPQAPDDSATGTVTATADSDAAPQSPEVREEQVQQEARQEHEEQRKLEAREQLTPGEKPVAQAVTEDSGPPRD
jgi:sec-independent protein translocase protein TatB